MLTTPSQQELSSKIKKLSTEVVSKDRELAARNLALKEARRQQGAVHQRLTQLKQTVGQTLTKTMKLIQQKIEVEKQIQLREQELQFLCTGHQKDSEQFRSIFQNRDMEVRELQHRLNSLMSVLASERKIIQCLKHSLHQANAELAEKSAQVQEQEKSNGDFKILLDKERQWVDQLLMQITSTRTAREQQHNYRKNWGKRILCISSINIAIPITWACVHKQTYICTDFISF